MHIVLREYPRLLITGIPTIMKFIAYPPLTCVCCCCCRTRSWCTSSTRTSCLRRGRRRRRRWRRRAAGVGRIWAANTPCERVPCEASISKTPARLGRCRVSEPTTVNARTLVSTASGSLTCRVREPTCTRSPNAHGNHASFGLCRRRETYQVGAAGRAWVGGVGSGAAWAASVVT